LVVANLVNLEAVSKSFGVRALLDGVSLGVGEGDRIGVVGLNGGGKTTLLEVLAGLEPPDEGRVSRGREVRAGVVTQRTELAPDATVRQAVIDPLGTDAEHEWASDARIRGILDGLGISDLGLDAPVRTMSGGERRRVALAATLVGELDLLILDEPTNHLDVEGVRWLAEHLLARKCGLVVVTHDRWFLDTVCSRTWRSSAAGSSSTRAATRTGCSPAPNGPGWPTPWRSGGATSPARNSPGCAAAHPPARRNRGTGSRRPKS
jgi:ABC transport system ATP-binding/permease protein